MGRLAERYLEAVDLAWNFYGQQLTLEQWAASRGYLPDLARKLCAYLEARGVL